MDVMMGLRYLHARIGIDLDNTLISYDRLFTELASERGFVPAGFVGTKREICERVRSLPDGDVEWQRMQAQAYGPAIVEADAADGALHFVREARRRGAELMIVSHKTQYSTFGSAWVNLRHAAASWLRASGIVGSDAVFESSVYFEESRKKKVARIGLLRCTHFIDDLQEVLNDAEFPVGVERILLSSQQRNDGLPYRSYASFRDIARDFTD